jgi:hypothetical protein
MFHTADELPVALASAAEEVAQAGGAAHGPAL